MLFPWWYWKGSFSSLLFSPGVSAAAAVSSLVTLSPLQSLLRHQVLMGFVLLLYDSIIEKPPIVTNHQHTFGL